MAVDAACHKHGIATALTEALLPIARACGAWVVYVHADYGDEPAIALYTKLGVKPAHACVTNQRETSGRLM